MQRISLLYIITKLELGGCQKQLLNLISHLDTERFNLFLFTAKEGLLARDASGIKELTLYKSRYLERPINPLKDLLALVEIYRFIKRNGIEIVHTHSSKAGILGRWAARFARAKIIIHTVHGWSFNDYQPSLLRRIFVWLERFTARFTDKLIVVSSHDQQKGLANRIGVQNKYHLIRYGINYAEFDIKDRGINREFGIDNGDLVVGMVSCFKPQKSPQDFLKLALLVRKILPNIKFILTGDGVLRKNLEELISKFNLQKQVILTGWRRDIPQVLSAIDVFVLTSLWEGLPIAVLEAMAASKPVVATHTGGVTEVTVEGKTGFLVSPGDVKKMSEKLIRLLRDESLRKQIGRNAKDSLSSNFSFENMVKNTDNLYKELIERKESRYAN